MLSVQADSLVRPAEGVAVTLRLYTVRVSFNAAYVRVKLWSVRRNTG